MSTALVTGASSGIGTAFARRLARIGHPLVLTARNESRLESLAAELRTDWGVNAEVLVADLATEAGCAALEQRAADPERPVDVLVNNAGFGLGTNLLHSDVEDEDRMLRVLVRAPMRITKAALPGMLERGRGSIVTVASVTGIVSYNSYGAAKAWAVHFSQSLSMQLSGSGVRAIALCPGLTRTRFHENESVDVSAVPNWLWLDADRVVDHCLRDLARGKMTSIPGRQYQVIAGVGRHLPAALAARVASTRGQRRR